LVFGKAGFGAETALFENAPSRFFSNRWGGCRPPQTASQCAKVVVFTATERKGRQP
jgi:hypothetical protein